MTWMSSEASLEVCVAYIVEKVKQIATPIKKVPRATMSPSVAKP